MTDLPPDPAQVVRDLAKDTADLDRLSKAIHDATEVMDDAEQKWESLYDDVMKELEDEFAEAGRKSVPEHTAISAARRAHRGEWIVYRNAKRRLEKLQQQLKAKVAATSGRQSELGALRDEAKYQDYAGQHEPVQTFGARRAA